MTFLLFNDIIYVRKECNIEYNLKYNIGDLLKTKDDFIVEVREIFYDNFTRKWYYSVSPIGFDAPFNREIEEGKLKKVN